MRLFSNMKISFSDNWNGWIGGYKLQQNNKQKPLYIPKRFDRVKITSKTVLIKKFLNLGNFKSFED